MNGWCGFVADWCRSRTTVSMPSGSWRSCVWTTTKSLLSTTERGAAYGISPSSPYVTTLFRFHFLFHFPFQFSSSNLAGFLGNFQDSLGALKAFQRFQDSFGRVSRPFWRFTDSFWKAHTSEGFSFEISRDSLKILSSWKRFHFASFHFFSWAFLIFFEKLLWAVIHSTRLCFIA